MQRHRTISLPRRHLLAEVGTTLVATAWFGLALGLGVLALEALTR